MRCRNHRSRSQEALLDTLAQTETLRKGPTILLGKGILADESNLRKLGSRKILTQKLILSLIDQAELNGDWEMYRQYWNCYHCLRRIILHDENMHGNYCKSRVCLVCQAIRSADKIQKYLPEIARWPDPQLLTLTIPSIGREQLQCQIRILRRSWVLVKNRLRKRARRSKIDPLKGIRCIECSYNLNNDTFNPHLHVLLPSITLAKLVRQEWLLEFGGQVECEAQNITKIDQDIASLRRVLIYFLKIFPASFEIQSASKEDYQCIHIINKVLKGMRLFERFGFNLNKVAAKRQNLSFAEYYEELVFSAKTAAWHLVK